MLSTGAVHAGGGGGGGGQTHVDVCASQTVFSYSVHPSGAGKHATGFPMLSTGGVQVGGGGGGSVDEHAHVP